MRDDTKRERLIYLDFIRVMATAMVLVLHFSIEMFGKPVRVFNGSNTLAAVSTSLFLCISGAALLYSSKEGKLRLALYVKKRFLSIYPNFWVAFSLATTYFFFYAGNIGRNVPAINAIWSLLGLDGFLSTVFGMPTFYCVGEWFLGAILICYMLFPLLRYGFTKQPLITLIIVISGCIAATYCIPMAFNVKYCIVMPLISFTLGFYYLRYCKQNWIWALGAAAVIAVTVILKPPTNDVLIAALYGFCLMILLGFIGKCIRHPLVVRALLFLSKLSFPVILTHHAVITALKLKFYLPGFAVRDWLVLLFITLALTFLTALIVMRLSRLMTDKWILPIMDLFQKPIKHAESSKNEQGSVRI